VTSRPSSSRGGSTRATPAARRGRPQPRVRDRSPRPSGPPCRASGRVRCGAARQVMQHRRGAAASRLRPSEASGDLGPTPPPRPGPRW
jgi:hypothetical protein